MSLREQVLHCIQLDKQQFGSSISTWRIRMTINDEVTNQEIRKEINALVKAGLVKRDMNKARYRDLYWLPANPANSENHEVLKS